MRTVLAIASVLLLAACGSGEGSGGADDEAAGIPDRITLVVPTPPGSSFDTWARAISPRLGDALETTVVVDNEPGASGLVALNNMAQGKPDGSKLVLWQLGPLAIMKLQGVEDVRFDLRELSYVGNFATADHMLFVGKDSPLRTVDDLLAADGISFASGERGSLGYTSQQVVAEALDIDAKFIPGYDDQAQRLNAIERGDADAVIGPVHTFESIGRLGDVRPLLRLVNERSARFPDVPTAAEVDGLDAESRELLATHFGMASAFYTVMGSPTMPENTLDALREAFWAVANDDDFLAELSDKGWDVSPEDEYLKGEQVVELIPQLLEVPANYQSLLDELSE